MALVQTCLGLGPDLWTIYSCGLRRSEAVALSVDDIDSYPSRRSNNEMHPSGRQTLLSSCDLTHVGARIRIMRTWDLASLVSVLLILNSLPAGGNALTSPATSETDLLLSPPISMVLDIDVTVQIDEVLSGSELAVTNRELRIPEDTSPTLMVWSSDLKDHFGQKAQLTECSPKPTRTVTEPENGNRILMWDLSQELQSGTTITLHRHYEITNACYDPGVTTQTVLAAYRADDPVVAFYTKSEPYVGVTNDITSAARHAIGTETNPVERARLIFRFVQQHMRYVYPPPQGLRGATSALQLGKGDCGQYADLFVAMCRSVGIPARLAAGFGLAPGRPEETQTTVGSHAWAEFMLPDGRWLPADPTRTEERCFARMLDVAHLTASVGRNIPLPGAPAWANARCCDMQHGRTPFMQTYTEIMTGVRGSISARRTRRPEQYRFPGIIDGHVEPGLPDSLFENGDRGFGRRAAASQEPPLLDEAVEQGHHKQGDQLDRHAAERRDCHGDHDVGAAPARREHRQQCQDGGGRRHETWPDAPCSRLDDGGPDLIDCLRLLLVQVLLEIGRDDNTVVRCNAEQRQETHPHGNTEIDRVNLEQLSHRDAEHVEVQEPWLPVHPDHQESARTRPRRCRRRRSGLSTTRRNWK